MAEQRLMEKYQVVHLRAQKWLSSPHLRKMRFTTLSQPSIRALAVEARPIVMLYANAPV